MKLFLHEDCMDVMKRYPDNYFDLAIVDPPYFSGPEKRKFYGRKVSPIGVSRLYDKTSEWKIPNRDYFDELFRVSKKSNHLGRELLRLLFWSWSYCLG